MAKNKITVLLVLVLIFTIYLSDAQNIFTVAGTGIAGYNGEGGMATASQLNLPTSVTTDASGNIYVADVLNSRIRMINASGIITTYAGNGTSAYGGDGGNAVAAALQYPYGIVFDAPGNGYIVDRLNNVIRKVTPSGIISTFAGNGNAGFSGDGAAATTAQLSDPTGVAIDASGNVYICDKANQRIRKVNTSGIISTIAGIGTVGAAGDGSLATSAQLNFPARVLLDAAGNIYISDYFNNKIRKINTSGIISTIAGTGNAGSNGDGGAATSAELNRMTAMAFDSGGNMYIADTDNNRIRKINTSGIISTVAGNGIAAFGGDGNVAINSQLNAPIGLSIDAFDNLYICDQHNQRVRTICSTNCVAGITAYSINDKNALLYPNPNNGSFNLQLNSGIENAELHVINSYGNKVYEQKIFFGQNDISIQNLASGLYSYIIIKNKTQLQTGKLSIE